MNPTILGLAISFAAVLILEAGCSAPQPPPNLPVAAVGVVPAPKSYSCDFAMKLAPQLLAAPDELKQFVLDYEKERYQLAAARGEPDPHCKP